MPTAQALSGTASRRGHVGRASAGRAVISSTGIRWRADQPLVVRREHDRRAQAGAATGTGACSRRRRAGSTLLVGSSASSRLGRPTTARPTATSCRWPIDSSGGFFSITSPSPSQASRSETWLEICSSAAPPSRKRQRHIVERGQVVEQAEILEHHADPRCAAACSARGRAARHRARTAMNRPRDGGCGQAEQPQQRALAGTAGADEEMEAAGGQPQVESCSTSGPAP